MHFEYCCELYRNELVNIESETIKSIDDYVRHFRPQHMARDFKESFDKYMLNTDVLFLNSPLHWNVRTGLGASF